MQCLNHFYPNGRLLIRGQEARPGRQLRLIPSCPHDMRVLPLASGLQFQVAPVKSLIESSKSYHVIS